MADTPTPAQAEREANQMDLLCAVANARYALEYWHREAKVCGKDAGWLVGPMQRGQNEIATLAWIERHPRARLATAAGTETPADAAPGRRG